MLTDYLKRRQTEPSYITRREGTGKYRHENHDRHHHIHRKDEIDVQFASEEQRGHEQGDTLDIAGSDPQLRRQIRAGAGKYSHTLVGQGVDEVKAADEQIGDPQEEDIVTVQTLPGVPGKDEDAAADDNAEYLRHAVEQEVAIQTDQVEAEEDQAVE